MSLILKAVPCGFCGRPYGLSPTESAILDGNPQFEALHDDCAQSSHIFQFSIEYQEQQKWRRQRQQTPRSFVPNVEILRPSRAS
jgi:hypothetical protein